MRIVKIFMALVLLCVCITGCVSQTQYNSLLESNETLMTENDALKKELEIMEQKVDQANEKIEKLEAENISLKERLDDDFELSESELSEVESIEGNSLGEQLDSEADIEENLEGIKDDLEEAGQNLKDAWMDAWNSN